MFAITNRLGAPVASVVERSADESRAGTSISLDRVTVSYGERVSVALTDVSLRVGAGEFVCLLGPSGSGKSSILNVVAGLVSPKSGSVSAGGVAVKGPGPERAVVFQDAALFPWLTLRKNIEFPLGVQGVGAKERAEKSERLLRLVHLWKFRDAHPHELSGGMRQRGAIARALATDPSILLMDEPFAALDAQTREILHGELERIWGATRKTVVFVTHNVRGARRAGSSYSAPGRGASSRSGRSTSLVPAARAGEEVNRISGEIGRRIAVEVEKVASEEADDARDYSNDGVRRPGDRAVGARH